MKTLFLLSLIILPFTGISQQVDLVTPLQDSLIETSGLILLDDRLITHNDSGGEAALFEIDSVSGGISRKVIIENAPNLDWEDLCFDDTHIYIADFGNNSGSRTNLRIYRVSISDYLNTPNDTISADTILFDYADQTDFTPTTFSTNYDAEALISWNDSLYIFTKNWGNQWTNIYALPKTPGNYSLPKIDSIDVEGLVTGGSYNPASNSIILSCYLFTYPFVVEISGFTNSHFSSATVERTQIQLTGGYSYQLEGIAPIGVDNYYLSTEESITGASGLFRLKMNDTSSTEELTQVACAIYPNPSSEYLMIDCKENLQITLLDATGKRVLTSDKKTIDVSEIDSGSYLLVMKNDAGRTLATEKVIVK